MPRKIDPEHLFRLLCRELASGPKSASELTAKLDISQPTLSRIVTTHRDDVILIGRARATRYVRARTIEDLGRSIPIYEVDESGGARELCRLLPIYPEGFFVDARTDDVPGLFFPDLPYFLNDIRPSGFLGRLAPRQHPELGLPPDVRNWSADHVLRYAGQFGWDLPGSLVIGDAAFRLHLERSRDLRIVPANRRAAAYSDAANDVLHATPAGSSAGGEQPKFLAVRSPGPKHVLVKFTPPVKDAVTRRYADLLIAEHVAHSVMNRHGHGAPVSRLLQADARIFLEIERFDRLPIGGRRGLISLLSLDAEFLGLTRSWTESAFLLAESGHLSAYCIEQIRWREWFGHLIANTDMHFANISFFARGARITALAPAYDMVPMAYAPQQGNVLDPELSPPIPDPTMAPLWDVVCKAAQAFWAAVAAHDLVSARFKKIAIENRAVVEKLRELGKRLPR